MTRTFLLRLCVGLCTGLAACGGGGGADEEAGGPRPYASNVGGGGAGVVGAAGSGGGQNAASNAGSAGTTTATATNGWPSFATAKSFQLRRLTTEQYIASVQALLGVDTDGIPPIEGIAAVGGFSAIGASSVSVSGAGVGQFENAARYLAGLAFAAGGPGPTLVGCTPTGLDDTACFESFVTSFGQKAFRRPLTAAEVTRYATLTADVATATGDAWKALEATLSAFLQSPYFLYLSEVGAPDPANANRYQFTDYEMASRLSYFLTNNTPDDALLASAAAGALLTSDGIQAAVDRLLALPVAHSAVGDFFANLLSLHNLDTLTRPVEVFPLFTSTLGAAMKQETEMVIDDLVFTRDGDYRHLFDQTETFINPELAALYGLPAPVSGDFEKVTLPAGSGRVGLLGQAGVLAARDHSDGTSPTKRGLFILTRLLCQNLPLLPPANLPIPPAPMGILTARQRFTQHATDAVCAGCHSKTDPVGFSLEHFDAMGVYREKDHDLAIDDSGVIDGVTYQGEPGLGAVLRDHPALGPCLIQSLYGVGVGHLATEFDHETFAAMVQQFDANGSRIKALLAAIVTSDGFRFTPPPTEN